MYIHRSKKYWFDLMQLTGTYVRTYIYHYARVFFYYLPAKEIYIEVEVLN